MVTSRLTRSARFTDRNEVLASACTGIATSEIGGRHSSEVARYVFLPSVEMGPRVRAFEGSTGRLRRQEGVGWTRNENQSLESQSLHRFMT